VRGGSDAGCDIPGELGRPDSSLQLEGVVELVSRTMSGHTLALRRFAEMVRRLGQLRLHP
jgi:hypothetical protein